MPIIVFTWRKLSCLQLLSSEGKIIFLIVSNKSIIMRINRGVTFTNWHKCDETMSVIDSDEVLLSCLPKRRGENDDLYIRIVVFQEN